MNFPSLKEIANNSLRTFYRFPFAIICAIVGTSAAIWLVDIPWQKQNDYYYLLNLACVAVLSIAVFLSITTLAEQLHWDDLKKYSAKFITLAFLALYYVFLPEDFSDSESEPFIRYLLFLLAAHLLVSFSPFIKSGRVAEFWAYNKTLLIRIVISGLYSAVLFAGLSIAILSLNELLGLNIDDSSYGKLWFFLVGIFNTWFFLAGVPKPDNLDAEQDEYPSGLKIFVQYILIPLVCIYILILYLYTGKIIIEWEWPNGWVANLVLSFSIAGIFALLLLHPLRNDKKHRWIQLFSQGYYLALIPLIILLALSIWVRISEYGITVNRYFVMILAIWLSGIVIYFLAGKTKNIKVIPISLFVLALLISFGPLGAFEVSKRSQLNRLETLLLQNNLLDENGKIKPEHPVVTFSDRKQMSSIIDYLAELKGPQVVQPFFQVNLKEEIEKEGSDTLQTNHTTDTDKIMALVNIDYVPRWRSEKYGNSQNYFHFNFPKAPLQVTGYDIFLSSFNSNQKYKTFEMSEDGTSWKLTYDSADYILSLEKTGSGKSIELAMQPFVAALNKKDSGTISRLSASEMVLQHENEHLAVMLLFKGISGNTSDTSISYFDADLFVSEK